MIVWCNTGSDINHERSVISKYLNDPTDGIRTTFATTPEGATANGIRYHADDTPRTMYRDYRVISVQLERISEASNAQT